MTQEAETGAWDRIRRKDNHRDRKSTKKEAAPGDTL
jgi:hypothetical protein